MRAQSRTQRPAHGNPNNMKPATVQPKYNTCARSMKTFAESSAGRIFCKYPRTERFDELSARRIYPNFFLSDEGFERAQLGGFSGPAAQPKQSENARTDLGKWTVNILAPMLGMPV